MKTINEIKDIINNKVKGTKDVFLTLDDNNYISLNIGILEYDNKDTLCIMPTNNNDGSELDYYYFTELNCIELSNHDNLKSVYEKYMEFYNKYIVKS